ncbi:MAG TPA: Clp protease N-terminal domain-containing protein [Gemmatimonadaceae bacterium]
MRAYPFNYHARQALRLARVEAAKLGDTAVEPRHIVLGLIREGESAALPYLTRSFADLEVLCRKLEQAGANGRQGASANPESLPYSPGAQRVLDRAITEARRLDQAAVGGVHLLLGALPARRHALYDVLRRFKRRSPSNVAAMALLAGGLRFEWLRADLARITADLPLDSW